MAKKSKQKSLFRRFFKWIWRGAVYAFLLALALVTFFGIVNPVGGIYMASEKMRLGQIGRVWTDLEDMSAHVPRSVVAAEDANFCLHNGIDFEELQNAIAGGGQRGASTITQQVAKNLFLWHGRSYLRKGLEAGFAILIEIIWTKHRILEVYLNIAEFDEGVFGVGAASGAYYGTTVDQLGPERSARLAAILPDPKGRSAAQPSSFVRKRTRAIMSGAGTILADGRSACFDVVE